MSTSHDREGGERPAPAQKRRTSALLKQLETLNAQGPILLDREEAPTPAHEAAPVPPSAEAATPSARPGPDVPTAPVAEPEPQTPPQAAPSADLDGAGGTQVIADGSGRGGHDAHPQAPEIASPGGDGPAQRTAEPTPAEITPTTRERSTVKTRPDRPAPTSEDAGAFPDHRYRPKARRRKPARPATATREAATTYVVPRLYEDLDTLARKFKFDAAFGARPVANSRLVVTAIEELLPLITASRPSDALLSRLRRPRDYETKKLGFSLPIALRKKINRALEAVNENRPRGAYQVLLSHVAEVALEDFVPRLLFADSIDPALVDRIRGGGDGD